MPAFAGMTGDGSAGPRSLSPVSFSKSRLQGGKVVAHCHRVGMVRPEARLKNRDSAAQVLLGLVEAARILKQPREIV
jgi:hypothetical protein